MQLAHKKCTCHENPKIKKISKGNVPGKFWKTQIIKKGSINKILNTKRISKKEVPRKS